MPQCKIKVTRWVNWPDGHGHPFTELPNSMFEDAWKAVVREMKSKGYRFTGESHQNCPNCVPLINGKYTFELSMRNWGRLMAEVLGLEDEFAYCEWAWAAPEGECEILPAGKRI